MRSKSSPFPSFKKPTIKEFGRAYVRLFSYFETPEASLIFLSGHTIVQESQGPRRSGDCLVRVLDGARGKPALLGPDVPNVIQYVTNHAQGRAFWVEYFLGERQARKRTWEVGQHAPSSDILTPR